MGDFFKRREVMIDWQPIETVPQNERILVAVPVGFSVHFAVVYVRADEDGSVEWTEHGFPDYDILHGADFKPTHWARVTMPLTRA